MEVPASITCPDCRQRWQRLHTSDGKAIIHSPIGYVVLYLELDGQETYFTTCRSYADLRATIGKMEPGTRFSARLNIFVDEIGGGYYRKTERSVEVRSESRAAEGLWLTMVEAESC